MTDQDKASFIQKMAQIEAEVNDTIKTYEEVSRNHDTNGSGGWVNEESSQYITESKKLICD